MINQGCVNIRIDEIVPCLKNTNTGELEETVVFRIESRKYLKLFQKTNGWNVNWNELPIDVEIYALALKKNNEIQGLIGIKKDYSSYAAYIHWACTAPWNNIYEYNTQKYIGVGGHLFAIAADKSMDWGFEGAIHGFALNRELLIHYQDQFGAEYLGMLHQYQFFIGEAEAKKLLEVYQYEWNET